MVIQPWRKTLTKRNCVVCRGWDVGSLSAGRGSSVLTRLGRLLAPIKQLTNRNPLKSMP
jgi:hypothetical protein